MDFEEYCDSLMDSHFESKRRAITDPIRDLDLLYRRLAKAIRLRDRVSEITTRRRIERLELALQLA